MKTKYEVCGRLFDDDKEALKYEKEVEAKEEKKRMLAEEKDKRWQEVKDAYAKAEKLLTEYNKDYNYFIELPSDFFSFFRF